MKTFLKLSFTLGLAFSSASSFAQSCDELFNTPFYWQCLQDQGGMRPYSALDGAKMAGATEDPQGVQNQGNESAHKISAE